MSLLAGGLQVVGKDSQDLPELSIMVVSGWFCSPKGAIIGVILSNSILGQNFSSR